MNKNNIEVELKYRVKDEKKLNKWLEKNAKKIFEKRQVDKYYTPQHRNFFDEKYPSEYLRIRDSGGHFSITYKYWHSTGIEREYSHCDEYETDIEDGKQMEKIFKVLDFKLSVIVDKTRTTYHYKDFEIEIDDVKDIGHICEIEMKSGFKDVDKAREMIRNLAEELGFSEEDREEGLRHGYVPVIAKKKGILK